MKLLFRILFFIFTLFIIAEEIKSSAVVNLLQEEISYLAAEKASINKSGSFLLKEGGTEVKYFAKSLEDAYWYGSRLYPEGYSVIRDMINPVPSTRVFCSNYLIISQSLSVHPLP